MNGHLEFSMAEQLKITESTVARWKDLFEINDVDVELLRAVSSAIVDNLDPISDEFYAWQTAQPEAASVIGDKDTLNRLRDSMRTYICELFEGYYDLIYTNKRLRIGRVHYRIGVTPTLYMASVRKLHEILRMHLTQILEQRNERDKLPKLVSALTKIMTFDSQIIFMTYIGDLTAKVETSNREMLAQSERLEEKVAEKTERLEHLSMRDPLTGLFNRRAFVDGLRRDIALAERSSQPVSLVFIDVNKFKALNDSEGHIVGDSLLKTLADSMSRAARETDTVCRYGGDEFCAILPRADAKSARVYCQRIIEIFDAEKAGDTMLSMGIAQSGPEVFINKDALVNCADEAMYRAKDTVAVHPSHKIVCYEDADALGANVTEISRPTVSH